MRQTKDFITVCKWTDKSRYQISILVLKKLYDEANTAKKLPLLLIDMEDEKNNCLWKLEIKFKKEKLNAKKK